MKLVIHAEKHAAPGSHILRTPKLEEAIEALKVDGWKVTLLETAEGVYPSVSIELDNYPPPACAPVDRENWEWVHPYWVPKPPFDNRVPEYGYSGPDPSLTKAP